MRGSEGTSPERIVVYIDTLRTNEQPDSYRVIGDRPESGRRTTIAGDRRARVPNRPYRPYYRHVS